MKEHVTDNPVGIVSGSVDADVVLSPVEQEHLTWLRDQRNRAELNRWFRQPWMLTTSDQEKWFHSLQNREKHCFIVTAAAGESSRASQKVGYVALNQVNFITRTAEFSIFIVPEFQAHGYGKKALEKLFAFAFDNLNMHLIWGEVYEGNPALALYLKMGFRKEGVLRDRAFKEGRYWSSTILSLTENEWRLQARHSSAR